jgi:Flp pilus assembly protein TadD
LEAEGVDGLLRAGEALMAARRYEQAHEMALRALSLAPGEAAAHALAAQVLMEMKRHLQAIEAATRAVSADPQWPFGHMLLSVALRNSPDNSVRPYSDKAIGPALEAIRLAPTDWRCHVTLAEAYAGSQRLQDADLAVRQALALNPRIAGAWVTASYIALLDRNWYAAEDAARRALSIEPGNRAAMNNLGVVMRRQGKWSLGAVAFLDAARIDPRSENARSNVEAIGFLYMARYAPVLLAPLLIIWPLFLYARGFLVRWLHTTPVRLKPLARRIGIRVASSPRYRQRFEKESAQAQKHLNSEDSVATWSALDHGKRVKVELLATMVTLLAVAAVIAAGVVVSSANPRSRSLIVIAVIVVILSGVGPLYRLLATRRRD